MKVLALIKGRRDKTGSIGPHQIGLPDIPENKKLLQRTRENGLMNISKEVHLIVHYCRMNYFSLMRRVTKKWLAWRMKKEVMRKA